MRAAAHYAPDSANEVATLPYVDPSRFDDSTGNGDPFKSLGVRIVPENVSNIAKSDSSDGTGNPLNEKIVAIAKGESFRTLLDENGITSDDADAIIAALSGLVDLNRLHVGEKVRIAYATDADAAAPIRVSLYDEGIHQATVARTDKDTFVRANEPTVAPDTFADNNAERGRARRHAQALRRHLRDGARAAGAAARWWTSSSASSPSTSTIQARMTPGDSLEVFHSLPAAGEVDAGEPEILYASLTLDGVTKRFYRFRTPDDGFVDYYDEDGQERQEVPDAQAGPHRPYAPRRFGMRMPSDARPPHLHTGVDYAAPRGTPILAAGNGIIEKAGRTSGYGNFILIKHTNGYETAYGHQSKIRQGHRARRPRPPGADHRLCRLDRPVDRARIFISRSASTTSPSIRCASACRAVACSMARCWPTSSTSASASTTCSATRRSSTKVASSS